MLPMSVDSASQEDVYLVTGAAGFIGYHLCLELLRRGCAVVGVDNMNTYYDVNLKRARLAGLLPSKNFSFLVGDIADTVFMSRVFEDFKPTLVVNLAAQAGVRNSIEDPDAYVQSNLVGFFQVLEACRHHPVKHLVYASSSSVYGGNTKVPFEESDRVDSPVSLYAATKKADELMAHCYSHLYGIPATGLRFFTVYGPFGRPDMAYFNFVDKYFAGEAIHVYNDGDLANDLSRDFTYIDDVVEGLVRVLARAPQGAVPHEIFNIGNNCPERLMTFIATLEKCLGSAVRREIVFEKLFEPLKPGDVRATFASTELLYQAVGFKPRTSLDDGLRRFVDWYVDYYDLPVSRTPDMVREFVQGDPVV